MNKYIRNIFFRLLPRNAFVRSVGILVGGTASAQLLMVLTAPLLTRLFSPEDYGLFAVYTGLLGAFAVVASLRYELAIPLPEDDQTAANTVVLCELIVLIMSLLSGLIVLFAGAAIAETLRVPRLAGYLWLLPVGVLLIGTYQVFNCWAIRTKAFPAIAHTKIRQSLTTIVVQAVSFKIGPAALLLGQSFGQGMGSFTLAKSAIAKPEFRKVTRSGIMQSAVRYRHFPIFDIWYGIFFVVGQQLPLIMLAFFFGSGITGLYAIAHRVLALPSALIGGAIGNVFFANAAKANREGNLNILFENVNEKLTDIAVLPFIILFVVAPEIFAYAFGEQWRAAGTFARFMSIWIFTQFVTSPLTTLFTVMEKQKQGAIFQASMLIIRVSAIAIGAWLANINIAIILFSLGSALVYAMMNIWMAVILKSDILHLISHISKTFFKLLLITSPLIFFSLAFNGIKYLLSGLLITIIFFSIHFLGRGKIKIIDNYR